MRPERVAQLVHRWVRCYTRGLPTAVAQRRVSEIAADLNDHITHGRTHRVSDRRIAVSIVSRMARGLPADVSWRRQARAPKGSLMRTLLTILAALLFAGGIGVPAIVYGEADDAPGLQLIGVLFVAAAIFLVVRTVRAR